MKQSSVPVTVLTQRREDVEYFNKTMRDAGHPVRCRGLNRLEDLKTAIERDAPHLLIFFVDAHPASIREVTKIRQQFSRMSPLIVISANADEQSISEALQAGARDLVSTTNQERLCIVCERELRAFRLEQALNDSLRSAHQYKHQLETFMSGSTDAIAQVQEGIVVEANQAWADLFDYADIDNALGPLMDYFASDSQTTLKGALIACSRGQWDGDSLNVDARTGEGQSVPIRLELQPSTYDGEPATRLSIRQTQAREPEAGREKTVEQVLRTDPTTGLFHRQQFLEILTDKLDQHAGSGARALAFIRPDRFGEIEMEVGPVSSEELLRELAEILSSLMSESDTAGRFGGNVFAIVLERGSLKDIQSWAENAVNRVSEHMFEVSDRSISMNCSIGLAEIGEGTDRVEALVASAEKANRHSRQTGGNRVSIEETADESTRIKRVDALWVQQIKSALVENRFQLVHLNIANLGGASERLFDTFVQMIDEQGDEIAASDFLGTAKRNKLLRAIDRWVINASVGHCKREASDVVFVKLSHESILDPTLSTWVSEQVQMAGIRPERLGFQVTESDASQYQKQTVALSKRLRSLGYRFAVERFGIGRDPLRVLANTPMDFVKFDGSLMQQISDPSIQDKLRAFVTHADRHEIRTIAARVENANTMAVLFQLGVGYMQGHYLHEPEVVLEEAI